MKIVDGVELHLIKNEKFKMNHITFRFSGEFIQKTVARRVLVAQILATANEKYPTAQRFRERLASLYGATLSTKVSTKGLVHIVDIELTFMKNQYVMTTENLLEEVIEFLYQVLFSPLVTVEQYQSKLFELEQANLINYLKADKDDSFYSSELQEFSNIVQEKLEVREVNQSVLQLGYSFPTRYGDKDYFTLLVFNGLFGGFAHSRLFTEVREKEGLAYTIGSHFDIFTGLLNVYAGIDKKNRNRAMQLINKQFSTIKVGRFSESLLKQTKKMLQVNLRLAGDSPKVLIERSYNGQYLKNHYSVDDMIDNIDKVSKADVMQLTRKIKLQALYFLEGK